MINEQIILRRCTQLFVGKIANCSGTANKTEKINRKIIIYTRNHRTTMESLYFDTDTAPYDIWRLILKRLKSLPDLRSFNMINKGCNIASNNSIRKQKLWWSIYRSRLSSELDISSSWPSKLFQTQHAWVPPINPIFKKDIVKAIKIIIVGDGGTGKTTYVAAIDGKEIRRNYLPSIGVDVRTSSYPSTYGPIDAAFWDTAGPEKFGALRDGYYIGAAAAIVFCDVTSRITIKNVPQWLRDIKRICPDIPIAICLNKIDYSFNGNDYTEKRMEFNYKTILRFMRRHPSTMLCEISNKAGYKLFDPILWICRQLTGDANLKMEFPSLKSPEREVNPLTLNTMSRIRTQLLLEQMTTVYEEDDFGDEIVVQPKKEIKAGMTASEIKKAMLERVLENCSPRLHAVMSRLLRGRTGAAVSTNPYQRPTLLYIEGLECNEFYSPTQFEFLAPFMEFYGQHKQEIIEEVRKCIGLGADMDPITSNISKYGAWKAFYFLESGTKIDKNHELAPTVSQLLTRVNSELMTCGFGYAYLSVLAPKAHITPHCGPCNVKLRCHLPVIVPSTGDASIRVGTTTRQFKQDELLIFDDSLEHEVRNDSDELRVVLLFDIWHHQLTKEEIKSITTYFS